MQTKPKSNSIVTSRYDEARHTIIFTVMGEGETELDLNKVSPANLAKAAIHGFNQRIPDAAAIGVTDADGNVIPKAERTRIKYERMNDLCRFYESGTEDWSRKGDGTGGSRSLTIEAIARCKGIEYEAAEDLVEEHGRIHKFLVKDEETGEEVVDRKKALTDIRKKSAKVNAMMAEIRQERDAKKLANVPSASDLLDGLGE